eukprot:CCRYP_015294-RA/>CCRYP_015294-RA protein AED:0.63 eAED:0.63 QI:0/-1/0/1/-1/1/1/0/113
MSSGKRTKHIKAKYFFVADKVAQGEVEVKHIPTNKMWVDINTKPKQGLGFRINRSELMNCDVDLDGMRDVEKKPEDHDRGMIDEVTTKITPQPQNCNTGVSPKTSGDKVRILG